MTTARPTVRPNTVAQTASDERVLDIRRFLE